MEKITSFTINHLKLLPGVYVSRVDYVAGNPVTTFWPSYDCPEPRTCYEHCRDAHHWTPCATFLRNDPEFGEKDIYFGPMGCRTGFYLVLAGEYKSRDIVPLMKRMFTFIAEFEGDIPGAAARDCGNYLDQNLGMAKYLSKKVSGRSSERYYWWKIDLSWIILFFIFNLNLTCLHDCQCILMAFWCWSGTACCINDNRFIREEGFKNHCIRDHTNICTDTNQCNTLHSFILNDTKITSVIIQLKSKFNTSKWWFI